MLQPAVFSQRLTSFQKIVDERSFIKSLSIYKKLQNADVYFIDNVSQSHALHYSPSIFVKITTLAITTASGQAQKPRRRGGPLHQESLAPIIQHIRPP